MTRAHLLFFAALLILLPGCRGTLTLFGVDPIGDDDDATGDDDDATGDDDDATGDDDDATGDDDDATGDDDDATEPPPGECAPAWDLNCGQGATDSWNNGADDSTDDVLEYSCLPNEEWTGPEFTYTFEAERDGEHVIRLYDFDEDLDLFVLNPGNLNRCDGDDCAEYSGNPPGQDELLTVNLSEGQRVYIVVDGHNGSVSDYSIRMECPDGGGDDDDDDDDDDSVPGCTDPVLARAHQETSAATWIGGSNGYSAGPDLNPSGQGTVWGAIVGDFDNDGAMDVITERQGNNGLSSALFQGDCNGGFNEVSVSGFSYTGLSDIYGVADLDQDGDLDAIGIGWNDGVGQTWLNGGDGTSWTAVAGAFELEWDTGDTSTRESVGFPAVDVDGDQLPDLLECNNNAQSPTICTIHNGVGDGTFVQGATFTVQRLANSMAAGDFNGDGAIDYIGGLDDDGDAGQVWIWEGSPLGPNPLPSGGGAELFDVEPGGGNDANEPGYGWLFPADADDDGDLDVFVTVMDPFNSDNHAIYLATNDGLGNFTVSSVGSSDSQWGGDDLLVQSTLGVPVRP